MLTTGGDAHPWIAQLCFAQCSYEWQPVCKNLGRGTEFPMQSNTRLWSDLLSSETCDNHALEPLALNIIGNENLVLSCHKQPEMGELRSFHPNTQWYSPADAIRWYRPEWPWPAEIMVSVLELFPVNILYLLPVESCEFYILLCLYFIILEDSTEWGQSICISA